MSIVHVPNGATVQCCVTFRRGGVGESVCRYCVPSALRMLRVLYHVTPDVKCCSDVPSCQCVALEPSRAEVTDEPLCHGILVRLYLLVFVTGLIYLGEASRTAVDGS